MKVLIVEDDFSSRVLLQEFLRGYGEAHIAVNGREAIDAIQAGLTTGPRYDLVCLDIMLPDLDGQAALKRIRELEEKAGVRGLDRVKVIMTTALRDKDSVVTAFREQCDGYVVKPVDKASLIASLRELGLVKS